MKKLLSKMDRPLLIVTIIFFLFGLIMILSASSMESFMRYNYSPYHYFFRQLIFLIMGMMLFIFVLIFPTKNYKKLSGLILGIVILALIGLIFYGVAIYLSTIFTAYLLGYKIWQKVFNKDMNMLLIGLIGLFVLLILNLIPGINYLVAIITIVIGLGLIFDSIKASR